MDAGPVKLPPETTLCKLVGPPAKTTGDVLVYAEDFNGAAVDPVKWNIANAYKGHADVMNTSLPANAVVHDGMLSMVTTKTNDPTYPYASGYIDTLGKFSRTYGKVEFRARFQFAAGIWSARTSTKTS